MTTSNGTPGTCIVIGGGGGIGRALLAELAPAGWSLVIAGRSADALDEAARGLGPHADRVIGRVALDARDFDAVDGLFQGREGVTAAVNLAGSILLKPAASTSADEFTETIDLNLRTAFATVRAAGRAMRKHGGSIVLMSSCAASYGLPNHEAISAAKGGVEGLVRATAASGAGSNIRCNAVAPGLTDTPMAARLTASDASRKASESMHPLGRLGRPEDIARTIAHLVHPANDWITGQVFGVDGGLSCVKPR